MFLDVVAETLQVAVDGRRAVAQREVDGATVAAARDRETRDITVGHGDERTTHFAVGLDVHSGMEVSGAQFAEVGRVEP